MKVGTTGWHGNKQVHVLTDERKDGLEGEAD